MKKIVMAIMAIFAYVFVADSAMALPTMPLDVTASVVASCNVTSTANVAFGAYDPINTADNIVGAGTFTFRCVKNTGFQLHIARTGNMTDGTDNLAYTLWSDALRTASPWASAAAAPPAPIVTPSPSNAPVTANVYGRIAALQDVGVGAYIETVTATITY